MYIIENDHKNPDPNNNNSNVKSKFIEGYLCCLSNTRFANNTSPSYYLSCTIHHMFFYVFLRPTSLEYLFLLPLATPRRQAEAFTIDLKGEGASSCASGSVCVPERLRRALEERQQLQRKNSNPAERPITAPASKKAVSTLIFERRLVVRE